MFTFADIPAFEFSKWPPLNTNLVIFLPLITLFFKYANPMFSRARNLMKVLTKCYEEQ